MTTIVPKNSSIKEYECQHLILYYKSRIELLVRNGAGWVIFVGRLYVYITEQCREEARTHGVLDAVESLAAKMEADQSAAGLERFPKPYLKKRFGKQGRLIVDEHKLGDDVLYRFVRYLIRGNSEYESFLNNPGEFHQRHSVNQEELEQILAERKKRPIARRQPLSEDEKIFLQHLSATSTSDVGTFMESYTWFERMQDERMRQYMSRYYDLVVDIFDDKLPQGETVIAHKSNPEIKILFRKFPQYGVTFLVAPLFARDTEDEEALRSKYKEVLESDDVSRERITRESRRAYPATIVFDEQAWMEIQDSVEANLALSPEEEEILESMLSLQETERRYPLFINGRPGSGKSTILQYLFAEHLNKYIAMAKRGTNMHPPLYLTYSDALLEQAKSAVRNILRCNAKRLEQGEVGWDDPLYEQVLQQSFRQFREFLLSELPEDVGARFTRDRYVDFGRFQEMWEQQRRRHPDPKVRDIGPELAWHVIRTYIKGMSRDEDEHVDPDVYASEMPRNIKTVPDDVFRLVYDKIWKAWYSSVAKDNGLWDDQDLVREVLAHATDALSRFPAVFCDEAQDFTSLELELIQKLSLYTNRDLPSYLARHVPFAFAGDPFQTLNPTGFNWDAVQASFHSNIVQRIDGLGEAKLNFNFQELHFNYRSSEHIVKLANLIQLIRGINLDIKGLKPQKWWTYLPTTSPVWFRDTDANALNAIREQEELVIIVPCQENGELDYVKQDPFLSSFALREDGNQLHRNILSPVRAKGLEYKRVLLYKFGAEALKRGRHLVDRVQNPHVTDMPVDERLEFEYFMNQLYVGVSRARVRLFVVDTDEAIEKFWSGPFSDARKRVDLVTKYKNDEWTPGDVSGLVAGDARSFDDERDDPYDMANNFMRSGRLSRDPHLLRLARDNFERAGRPELAKCCDAMAEEFEGNYLQAGEMYTSLGDKEGAARCYWSANNMEAVRDLVEVFGDFHQDPRYDAARLLLKSDVSPFDLSQLLLKLRQADLFIGSMDVGESNAWRTYFQQLIGKLSRVLGSGRLNQEQWRAVVLDLLDVMERIGLQLTEYVGAGEILSRVGEYERALALWRQSSGGDRREPTWVVEARAETEPYPHNIPHLHRLKQYEDVLRQWRKAEHGVSRDTPVNLLLDSAIEMGDVEAMRILLPSATELEQVLLCLERCPRNQVSDLKGAVPVAIARALENKQEWKELVKFAKTGVTDYGKLNDALRNVGMSWPRYVTIAAAVRVLARSETLDRAASRQQQTISEFLKEHLIVSQDASREHNKEVRKVHSLISLAEAGTAFEKAFRLVYALEYYEQWFRGSGARLLRKATEEEGALARERWILCKYRQGDVMNNIAHKEEAERAERQWGISVQYNPERIDYTSLEPLAELPVVKSDDEEELATEEPQRVLEPAAVPEIDAEVTLAIGDMRLRGVVYPKRRRIVWTREDTEEQLTCGPDTVSSPDFDVSRVDNDRGAWLVHSWNVRCELRNENGSVFVRLATVSGTTIFGVELPYPS